MSSSRLSLAWLAGLALALGGCGADDAPDVRKPAEPDRAGTKPGPRARPLIPPGRGHLSVMAPARGFTLRAAPRGRAIEHLRAKTRYGSPTVVWATKRRGPWLGVIGPGIGNNRIAWVDARRARSIWRTPYSLHADLSGRVVELRAGRRVMRRIAVTIGGPSTPTPVGRFTVTDKLTTRTGSVYGCCIVALSGTQPNLRPGWAGGNLIAIHGSPTQSVGAAASAGCLRARDRELRVLMKLLPVGTPVWIRP